MCRALNILLGLLSRVLYALHGFLMVWCVVEVKGKHTYWLLLIGVVLLSVEMAITIKCTHNAGWKRFCPAVFLYLITVIPSIWYLELELLECRKSSPPRPMPAHFLFKQYGEKFVENLVDYLEQTMFIVLVLGRWLMPKGDLSRDQLSQLLMVYVSLGADILDVSDTFKKSELRTNHDLIFVGLSLFTWALMKFPFPQRKLYHKSTRPKKSRCFEIWRLLITDGIQDGSFLVYRLYLVVKETGPKQDKIFFICKNIIMVMLVLYRIFMVCFGHRCEGGERSPQRNTESV